MTTEEEEKARAEAQARRQRILESSGDRMDVVTGGSSAAAEAGESSGGGGGGGSAKLAAARRRRFKKKSAAATEKPAAEAAAAAAAKPNENKKPDPKKDDDAVVVEEVNTPGVEADNMNDNKKKYMGVAKMRRKMLAEKKQQQQQEQQQSSSKTAVLPKTTTAAKPNHTISILMHALVVILLFVAGLDVGLQQKFVTEGGVLVSIPTGLAPREQLNVLGFLPKSMQTALGLPVEPADVVVVKQLETDEEPDVMTVSDDEGDEFDSSSSTVDTTTTPVDDDDGAKKEEEEPNIDPLFGIDLDLITAGPGLLNLLGRLAIKAHRINLAIFYYLPRRLVTYVVTTAQQLTVLPPILFLIALFLRQFVGHIVLGAKLPPKASVLQDEKLAEQHKDVMTMIKNFVSGFLLKSFPTAANLYDAWVHIRADMYVVLCGLLVGLLVTHEQLPWQIGVDTSPAESGGRDEL